MNCPVCGFRLNRTARYHSGNHEYPPRFVYRLYFCPVCQNEWINRIRRNLHSLRAPAVASSYRVSPRGPRGRSRGIPIAPLSLQDTVPAGVDG